MRANGIQILRLVILLKLLSKVSKGHISKSEYSYQYEAGLIGLERRGWRTNLKSYRKFDINEFVVTALRGNMGSKKIQTPTQNCDFGLKRTRSSWPQVGVILADFCGFQIFPKGPPFEMMKIKVV